MSNMSYCRFENTLKDFYDCLEHWDDDDLSESEKQARLKLAKAAGSLVFDELGADDEASFKEAVYDLY